MSQELHAHTPMLSVVDNRGLPVRIIACHRLATTDMPELRVTRNAYDPAGHMIASQDPRLSIPNQHSIYSLSGQVLSTDSVDAGWRVTLLGEAGQVLEGWDGRGTQRQVEYDELLRPVLIRETAATAPTDSGGTGFSREEASPVAADFSPDSTPSRLKPVPHATPDQDSQAQIVERFTYGGPQSAEHNQCNQLTRHDDTAGTLHHPDYGLLGSPLSEVRHFLRELDMPDWPLSIAERDALLETDGLESNWAFNALGEEIRQTDAMGNSRHFTHTVAGQLKSVALGEQILLHDIRYNAFDQVEQQTTGNGVISRSTYDPQDGRLIELRAGLAGAPPLQLLTYSYDPVGNIEQIEDAAQPVHFFANQRIDPINCYRYDTLYQLIEATGREVRTDASHGPALPELLNLPPDPNQLANYTQTYKYDAGGNLLEMHHLGAQPFNRLMRVAPNSNRSLPAGEVDVDFEEGFDANGNLRQLVRGQSLSWDARNQLRHITTVQREDGPSDDETYIYDGGGQRCRKVGSAQAPGRTLINEVRYLPGLEIRSNADGKILHVITVNNVRLLHWPAGTHSDQLRYSLSDHLGSSTLELDHQGGLISQESYYPFGGTSWWAARSATEAKYKTVRYSGKERDASGLYYYGYRYYAPWLQRWINPDPAGDVDGLNLFAFTFNSPIKYIDFQGAIAIPLDIFIQDIVNVTNRSIGTGEFEELIWDRQNNSLSAGMHVYGRGMKPIEGRQPEWELTEAGSAFALFRDTDEKLRLFVNNYRQHMGIQPGMGLPLAAGIIRGEATASQSIHFDNHSGHYKPASSIDVSSLLNELFPKHVPFSYHPLHELERTNNVPRIMSIESPETYADKVADLRDSRTSKLISFIKDEGLWGEVEVRKAEYFSFRVLFTMDESGKSREEATNFLNKEEWKNTVLQQPKSSKRASRAVPEESFAPLQRRTPSSRGPKQAMSWLKSKFR